jgi:hypothetical protein
MWSKWQLSRKKICWAVHGWEACLRRGKGVEEAGPLDPECVQRPAILVKLSNIPFYHFCRNWLPKLEFRRKLFFRAKSKISAEIPKQQKLLYIWSFQVYIRWDIPSYLLIIYIYDWWFQPLWKILVNGKDYPIYYGNKSKCSKPPIRYIHDIDGLPSGNLT